MFGINFPVSLSYSITAHKCQGQPLEEIVNNFGVDKEYRIRNFTIPGPFYVALTRGRIGSKVFLKSFEPSYIVVNNSFEKNHSNEKVQFIYVQTNLLQCI